jgi:predicted dehydrogenase
VIKKIKIAIIGAGNIAEEHIKAFKAQDNCDLIGIYSRTWHPRIYFRIRVSL